MPHQLVALRGGLLLILFLGTALKLAPPASSQTCPSSRPKPGSKAVRDRQPSLSSRPAHSTQFRPSHEAKNLCLGTCRKKLPNIRTPTEACCGQGLEQCAWEDQAKASQDQASEQAQASQGKASEQAGPSSSGQGWEATDVAGEYIVRFNDYRCAQVHEHDRCAVGCMARQHCR